MRAPNCSGACGAGRRLPSAGVGGREPAGASARPASAGLGPSGAAFRSPSPVAALETQAPLSRRRDPLGFTVCAWEPVEAARGVLGSAGRPSSRARPIERFW